MTDLKRRVIKMSDYVGSFAENKDVAKKLREEFIFPSLKENAEIEIDFSNVDDATQSFIHALLSEPIRETQGSILDTIYFKNCNETVKQIINMVVDYMSEAQE